MSKDIDVAIAEEKAKRKSRKPLTKRRWAEIAALWSIGEMTLRDLSEKFGVAPETISRKMKAMGVVKSEKAEEHAKQVRESVQQASADESKVLGDRIRETKNEHYRNARALSAAAMREVADAAKKKNLALAEPALKALERAAKVQDMTMRQRWTLLGLDKEDAQDDDLPDLTIRTMSDEEIEEVQRKAEEMSAGVAADVDPLSALDGEVDVIDFYGDENG